MATNNVHIQTAAEAFINAVQLLTIDETNDVSFDVEYNVLRVLTNDVKFYDAVLFLGRFWGKEIEAIGDGFVGFSFGDPMVAVKFTN